MPLCLSYKKDFNWQVLHYTTKRLKNYTKVTWDQERRVKKIICQYEIKYLHCCLSPVVNMLTVKLQKCRNEMCEVKIVMCKIRRNCILNPIGSEGLVQ